MTYQELVASRYLQEVRSGAPVYYGQPVTSALMRNTHTFTKAEGRIMLLM